MILLHMDGVRLESFGDHLALPSEFAADGTDKNRWRLAPG
jgi:hypothetical protein